MYSLVVISIIVVGVLLHCALLHSVWNLKSTQRNMQHSLIQELYEFKLGYNAPEATKIICCVKGEDAVNSCTVTGWFKKFCSGYKNLKN